MIIKIGCVSFAQKMPIAYSNVLWDTHALLVSPLTDIIAESSGGVRPAAAVAGAGAAAVTAAGGSVPCAARQCPWCGSCSSLVRL